MNRSPSPDPVAAYSPGHHGSVLASHCARTAANSCAYVLDRLREGDSVLDIGCGPGSITLDLAELVGPTGRVVGVDFAADAISAAQEAADLRGDVQTRFMIGDVFDLDLVPASFDVVHAHQVLQHLSDPVAGLQAMARSCRPGGIIAVRDADYGATDKPPAFVSRTSQAKPPRRASPLRRSRTSLSRGSSGVATLTPGSPSSMVKPSPPPDSATAAGIRRRRSPRRPRREPPPCAPGRGRPGRGSPGCSRSPARSRSDHAR